jgi:very-short-patch-repair endonuclease
MSEFTEPETDDESQTDGRDNRRAALIGKQVKVWSGQLVDLTGRNNLLFFKDLKRGTLDLTGVSSERLEAILSGQTVGLRNLYDDAEKAEDAVKRARTIRSKAAEHYEERGLETLYLACGLATWTHTRTEAVPAAPVLLCPARLKSKGSSQEDFELSLVGELEVNPTLLQLLATDFECQVTAEEVLEQAGMEGAIDTHAELEIAFEWLTRRASSVPGFSVGSRFVLGTFSYAKLPMVRDLETSIEAMVEHDLIAALAGDERAREALNTGGHADPLPNPNFIPPADEFLILDADSSQNSAINRALAGQNLIVKGPPGTGKSQTIANLIAGLVARGKKPLFVAEKRAAIDAVLKRLSAQGLDELVLDVHGGTGNKRRFAADLDAAIKNNSRIPEPDLGGVHRTLDRKRSELNDAAAAIHAPRAPWNVSVYEVHSRLLALPERATTDLRIRGEALQVLSAETMEEVGESLDEFVTRGGLDISTSPWASADVRTADQAEQLIRDITDVWERRLPEARRLTAEGAGSAGLALSDEPKLWATWISAWNSARRLAEVFDDAVYDENLSELTDALAPLGAGAITRASATITDGDYRAAKKKVRGLLKGQNKLAAATLHESLTEALALKAQWAELSDNGSHPRFPENLDTIAAADEALRAAVNALDATLGHEVPLADAEAAELERRCTRLLDDQLTLTKLPTLHKLRAQLERWSIEPLVGELDRRRADVDEAGEVLDHLWLTSVLEHVQRTDERVVSFDGTQQRRAVESFRQADREHIESTAQRVRRICAANAIKAMDECKEQDTLIRHQASLKRGHLPVRQLFGMAPDVLLALKPCWMMSPLVVSQLLPSDRQYFDVVIFDEASQIEPADAVPSLLRGKSVIVAGDNRQLPPTTFFAATAAAAEDTEDDALTINGMPVIAMGADSESILDALTAFIPQEMLLWHYRSRDERLIAFSNAHFYDRALTTFPGVALDGCVNFVHVGHEPGDHNSSRSSTAEVDAVVEQILEHASTRPHETLGVIAMGIFHADRIAEALRLRCADHPELDGFFAEENEERFFVKNLERVQGDERDAIILSVGYGKGPDGRLRHNFGPLSSEGGERRLNVAVTRAKSRMTVVSSLTSKDLDPDRMTRDGTRALRQYIEFAESSGANLGEGAIEHPALNGFEIDVRDSLDLAGVPVIPQWGCSGYFIDFAAKHPTRPGELVLAIECDGATYHSSASARDRDRLRQDHLERLGWTFHRIWSTDWFRNKAAEIELVKQAYENAVRMSDSAVLGEPAEETAAHAILPKLSAIENSPRPSVTITPLDVRPRRTIPFPNIPRGRPITDYHPSELVDVVRHVQSDTLLRTRDELVSEVMRELKFSRRGSRIVAAVERAVDAARVC